MKNPPKFYEKEEGRNNVFQIFTRLLPRWVWIVICALAVAGIMLGVARYRSAGARSFPELTARDYDALSLRLELDEKIMVDQLRDPAELARFLQLVQDGAGELSGTRQTAPGGQGERLEVQLERGGEVRAQLLLLGQTLYYQPQGSTPGGGSKWRSYQLTDEGQAALRAWTEEIFDLATGGFPALDPADCDALAFNLVEVGDSPRSGRVTDAAQLQALLDALRGAAREYLYGGTLEDASGTLNLFLEQDGEVCARFWVKKNRIFYQRAGSRAFRCFVADMDGYRTLREQLRAAAE